MATEQPVKLNPPSLPYKTLISSLENLGQGIPPQLDRTIWKNQPGTVQSLILSAYKFLGLMTESNQPTDLLRTLVEHRMAPTPILKRIIEDKYKPILAHNLSTMTITILSTRFEETFSIEGETKKKSMRFFLQACKANGFVMSKFLLDQTRASAGPRKRRAKRDVEESDDGGEDREDEIGDRPQGTQKVITLRSGGQLSMSLSVDLFALSMDDRTFVFKVIDDLQAYENATSKPESKRAES